MESQERDGLTSNMLQLKLWLHEAEIHVQRIGAVWAEYKKIWSKFQEGISDRNMGTAILSFCDALLRALKRSGLIRFTLAKWRFSKFVQHLRGCCLLL